MSMRFNTYSRLKARVRIGAVVSTIACAVTFGAGLGSASAAKMASPQLSVARSGKPVIFGASVPLSGFLASTGLQVEDALNAYAKFVNAHGGIGGRPLEWKYADDAYPSATQAAVAARTLAGDHVLGVLNFGTPGVDATYPFLVSANVPDFILFAGVTQFEPLAKSAFLVFSSYFQQGEAFGQYIAKKYPGQSVTVLYQDDDLGQSYLSGFKKFDPHVSVAESYNPSDSDFSSQINAMRASGSKLAACWCLSSQVAQLLQVGKSTGWSPTVITESSNAGASLISSVGSSLAQNVISMSFFPPTVGAGRSQNTVVLLRRMQSENPTIPVTSFTEVSAALSELLVSALSKLHGTITRNEVISALASTHATGGWYGRTGTSGQRNSPSLFSCWQFTVIKSGVSVPTGSVSCGNQLPRA